MLLTAQNIMIFLVLSFPDNATETCQYRRVRVRSPGKGATKGKMGTRNCINVEGTEKFSSCSSHKKETNSEKNTLSETGEGNVGLDLPDDAFIA